MTGHASVKSGANSPPVEASEPLYTWHDESAVQGKRRSGGFPKYDAPGESLSLMKVGFHSIPVETFWFVNVRREARLAEVGPM